MVERWSDGFRYEPIDTVMEVMEKDGVVCKKVQCGHWVRFFAYDKDTAAILAKWTIDARHYLWLQAQGKEMVDMGKFLEHGRKAREKQKGKAGFKDEAFAKQYPALTEYLTETKWSNGDPRETSTLLVFVEEGAFKACLNDRDELRAMWASAGTWEGLLALLEERLASGEDEWRYRQPERPGRKGGK